MTRPLPAWRARNRDRAMVLLHVLALVDVGAVWTPERVVACEVRYAAWEAALLMVLLERYGYLRRDGAEYGAYRLTSAGKREAEGR